MEPTVLIVESMGGTFFTGLLVGAWNAQARHDLRPFRAGLELTPAIAALEHANRTTTP
ncbi:hypothetical protein D9M70_631930 [compost metagenome]